ncbi:hypothetical protein QBC32DRAFT_398558 [Pseudoneurospora amorphoporcata]|uniref:HMG box domain-containing protein n=1 Tax=Pseudoneurospora amorphoporcata TaxID=241081 RepID=A0AAN6SFD5_9PEZI|nr:hypothetical protein QBC32DRAFT_398558 [Pseudoneurospora amorphoporcata]
MEPWVNRSAEIRHKELGLNKAKRPCNHFVLYSMACHPRAEAWREARYADLPKGSKSLSTIISLSWSMEPPSVKAKYRSLAEIELRMHAAAFPTYRFIKTKAAVMPSPFPANPSSTSQQLPAKLSEVKEDVASQPQHPLPFRPLTLQLPATVQAPPKELSPHILCQTSELMRDALYLTNKGLDYEMAVLEYNSFITSVHDTLKYYVRNLKPYVPRVFDLHWEYQDILGMYKVSNFTPTWPSMDLSMPVDVSTTMPMSVDIDYQLPLVGFEDNLTANLVIDPFAEISDEYLEQAFQEFAASGMATAGSEPAVNEPRVDQPAQVEVPLPDFTTIGALNDSDLLLDQSLSALVANDMDIMDFINFESEIPL